MKKLTVRNFENEACCAYDGCHLYEDCYECPGFQDILYKLAHYEDLEEAGRLVKLPCKVGDTVYFLNTKPHISLRMNEVYKAKVVRIVTIGSGSFVMIQMRTEYGCTELPAERCDFGKTVFLTREEAEAALKGVEVDGVNI